MIKNLGTRFRGYDERIRTSLNTRRVYESDGLKARLTIIRNSVLLLVLLAACPVIAVHASDLSSNAAATARRGGRDAASSCSACHGASGMGQAASGVPRLAGLDAAYLQKQLDDFAEGTRQNAVMQPIAKALDENQRRTLAAYFSKLSVQALPASHTPTQTANRSLGERLAVRGIWSRQVPGCVQCHGPHGVGVGAHFPPLAGQSASYIADQLRAWKKGTRRNDPLGLMQHVVSALSAKDIQAVSEWFASQPVVIQGGKS